jgi:hypothetical protein
MRKFALAFVALLALAQVAQAAPIQGVVDAATGATRMQGFTGEIFGAIRGPEANLLPANALPSGSLTLDATLPGEIAYLGLGGINGQVNVGNVVKAGLSVADLSNLKVAYQLSFTSEIVEFTPTFVTSEAAIPQTAGLFVVVPEPATMALAGMGLIGLIAVRRRNG